ncbi:MAG: hypothetical protein ABEK10_04165 [Candidatus Nanosalina sp.]
MADLLKEAERKGLRNLARDRDRSRRELVQELKDRGFSTIKEFFGKKEDDSIEMTYNLDEMEKRKLQGVFGEKVARFVEGRIRDFLKDSMGNKWEIRKGIEVKTKGENHRSMFYGLKPDENSGIKCSGKSVAHNGMENHEIREELRKMHYHVSKRLFKKFQEYQAPNIDECYYAIRKTGEKVKHEYRAYDRSSGVHDTEGEKLDCKLNEIEDFKIICLEVKTTSQKSKNLLSKTQREVRDLASETAFLDFYLVKVDYDIQTAEIPDSVDVEIEGLRK